MSLGGNRKTEGGHKRGHSNMTHWTYTSEVKEQTRHVRRELDRQEAQGHASRVEADPDVPRHRKKRAPSKLWVLEGRYNRRTWSAIITNFGWQQLGKYKTLVAAKNAFRSAQRDTIVGQPYYAALKIVGPHEMVFDEWLCPVADTVDNPGTSSSDAT